MMTFEEILAQVVEVLKHEGRVSYRALKRRFNLDDEYIDDLKDELIEAKQLATDEGGKVLVWVGAALVSDSQSLAPSTQPPDTRSQTLDPRPNEAERRQLTVMFCDLVGSTPLAEKLDPEELREVILAYQQVCAEAIQRFEGYLARYVGDGLLVYFGYPQAHEDDAQRAIRAGMGIVAALPDLNSRLQQTAKVLRDFPLQVRIGIHTGLVVVGDMGGGGYRDPLAIVGETPNIAARVQGIAEPNTVVISEATARLVQGLFECQDRGPQALKGVSTPVPVYHVLRESEAQSRFEVAVSTGLTPLVGREEELGLLRRRWEQAKAGAGQVVLLSGEPGIGKSRLVQTLKEYVLTEGATRIEFRCSAYHQNSAFYPIIEHLQRLLQFASHDTPQAKLAKLAQLLAHYRFPQADTLPLLATLLSLPHPEGCAPITSSPQKQKQKTQEALVAWMVEEAEQAAVFCAWEDLHWVDPSTLEVLTLLLEQIPTTRVFTVLTFRPDFTPPWGARSYLTQLTLSRLDRPQVETMVKKVTGGKALPTEVVQQIVAKTDGVPLFVEELGKMVVESGLVAAVGNHYELRAPLPPLTIPSTLHDSLMARLDRLAPVREIAQVGAVLGREFSYELLHTVSPLDEGKLQQGLRQLVEAELVYQRGLPPQATYLFRHALIQDAAYQSLLKSTRQQYHRQIAQVLEERFGEIKDTQPELLAHHYTEACLVGQAILYWHQAGQRAIRRSAYVEAISHLLMGLELLKTLPNIPERTQQELMLQITLGTPLMATKGIAAPEVEHTYARALELCRQMGETPQLFRVLYGLRMVYMVRGEHKVAHELARQLFTLAQSVRDPALLLQAHYALGNVLFFFGEFSLAREHLEQGIMLYDPQQHNPHTAGTPTDTGVGCRGFAGWVLWYLGYPDQALKRSLEGLTLAHELSHPFILAVALHYIAQLHQVRRDVQLTRERAEEAVTLSTKQGFTQYSATDAMLWGWALANQGREEEGIAQMRQGLVTFRATGAEFAQPFFLGQLAEVCGKTGKTEEGLTLLAEALAAVDKTGERFYEAELYRLKGELTLQSRQVGSKSQASLGQVKPGQDKSKISIPQSAFSNPQSEAEACFLKALEVARHQQAKSLELRAVMSLSRLWQGQGKKKEAHELLAEIYGWFTEGFDTQDLQEAKALLEALA
ncbi:MAG TPA: adenylate/guanylate cyclase domain-containing protein [Candidatus Binatia bacterium]|nr:adenylate/guanylate cyclase domain-containing protein [Candidatus Binatia bacterium]